MRSELMANKTPTNVCYNQGVLPARISAAGQVALHCAVASSHVLSLELAGNAGRGWPVALTGPHRSTQRTGVGASGCL